MFLFSPSKPQHEDALVWQCKFCRVSVGNTHREGVVRVHVLTSPDSNGDSEYKQYDVSGFHKRDGPDSFEAAVNAVAFSNQPLSGRCLVFINPVSGTRSGPKRFKTVHHLFHLVGLDFDAVTTTHHGHASEVVAKVDLKRYCAIVSVSGDGTLHEIFTALLARPDRDKAIRTPVGCIPAGSEGTLAKISTYFNPLAAAYVILKRHEIRPLDVLDVEQMDKHIFCVCGVGWGIPGKAAEESEALRGAYGRSRYAVSAIKGFVNLKGCKGSLHVLPAKERPLCHCGPRCRRCKSQSEIAERARVVEEQERQLAREMGGGREGGGDAGDSNVAEGDEELVFDETRCEKCGASYVSVKEGKTIQCPGCDRSRGGGGHGGGAGDSLGASGGSRIEGKGGAVLSAGEGGSGGRGCSGGGGEEESPRIVKLDYNKRIQGLGETADRGSGLLKLAEQWRREEEEAQARVSGKAASSSHAEGVWQQLDGEFIAIGGLNTEKISAPFCHMSDGCMDVIALPAQVGRMDLLQMGFELPTGGHLEDRRIFHWKATQLKFTPADPSDKYNVDGEVLDGLPITVKVLPSLARLITTIDEPASSEPGFFY